MTKEEMLKAQKEQKEFFVKVITDYCLKEIEKDEFFAKALVDNDKITIESIFHYTESKAKEKAKNGFYFGDNQEFYDWVKEFVVDYETIMKEKSLAKLEVTDNHIDKIDKIDKKENSVKQQAKEKVKKGYQQISLFDL